MLASIRYLWKGYERLFVRLAALDAVEPDAGKTLVFLRLVRYQGEPIALPDGTTLRAGDPAGEIHFNSRTMIAFHSDGASGRTTAKLAVVALRRTRQAFRHLAHYVREAEKYRGVQVFFGKTLLYRGAEGFGFTVTELPPGREKLFLYLYLRWLLVLYHPQGWKRLAHHSEALVPKGVWISRAQLFQHHLD